MKDVIYKNSVVVVTLKRKLPFLRLAKSVHFQVGYGCRQRRFAYSDINYSACSRLAKEKNLSRELMEKCGIIIPKGAEVDSFDGLKKEYDRLQKPVVIKPVAEMQGRGITTLIKTIKDAEKAFEIAKSYNKTVIIEEQIDGEDYRLLIINNKFVAGLKRMRPFVIGDGKKSIEDLIDEENEKRTHGKKWVKKILIEDTVHATLKEQGYDLESVPKEGEKVLARMTGNISSGGISEDVTDKVCDENIELAKRAAALFGLEIAGIDFLTTDITKPIADVGGVVAEINQDPDLVMHQSPYIGKPRKTAKALIDYVFPNDNDAWIPIWLEGKQVKDASTVSNYLQEVPMLIKQYKTYNSKDVIEIENPKEKLYNYLIDPLTYEITIK